MFFKIFGPKPLDWAEWINSAGWQSVWRNLHLRRGTQAIFRRHKYKMAQFSKLAPTTHACCGVTCHAEFFMTLEQLRESPAARDTKSISTERRSQTATPAKNTSAHIHILMQTDAAHGNSRCVCIYLFRLGAPLFYTTLFICGFHFNGHCKGFFSWKICIVNVWK